jgi:hypothetical protein
MLAGEVLKVYSDISVSSNMENNRWGIICIPRCYAFIECWYEQGTCPLFSEIFIFVSENVSQGVGTFS